MYIVSMEAIHMDINAKFALPTLVEALQNLAKSQRDAITQSRFETLALLLEHVEDNKMWETMLREVV